MMRLILIPAIVVFILLQTISAGCVISAGEEEEASSTNTATTTPTAEQLFDKANQLPPGSSERIHLLERVHTLEPKHVLTRVLLALDLLNTDNGQRAMQLLEECFDPRIVGADKVLSVQTTPSPKVLALSNLLARHFIEMAHYAKAQRFGHMALQISQKIINPQEGGGGGDVCTSLLLATMLDPFPPSMQAADDALRKRNSAAKAFLNQQPKQLQQMNQEATCALIPGAAQDPYTHCMLSLFYLSFYYRANVRAVAQSHFRMAAAAWPDLVNKSYTAPHVMEYDERRKKWKLQQAQPDDDNDDNVDCVPRKIKLGVISAAITEGHSVTEDFSGVLSRLDRNIFDVTYILIEAGKNVGAGGMASFTQTHAATDQRYVYGMDDMEQQDQCNAAWVTRRIGQEKVAPLQLDMILYLDLTMSGEVRRLGMQRLAPVQLNTHGHPVTSGHDRSIIQYYVSWQEAELDAAQHFYTEELIMIPRGKIHQYYEPRIIGGNTSNPVSRMDRLPFGHLTRRDFGLPPENNVKIYLCMQKPFKLHPEFDKLVCGILRQDPTGHVVLHRTDHEHTHQLFVERLQRAGCSSSSIKDIGRDDTDNNDNNGDDALDRVHFVPQQPHHRLLALYQQATVILDSYPAGGCTTTREVLELGKPLVTLPAKLLGSRWTLGYFNVIGLADHAKEALVAKSPQEYINLAVELGTNQTKRLLVEEAIREAAPRLFHRQEAVDEWQRILLEASPVKICEDDDKENQERGDEL